MKYVEGESEISIKWYSSDFKKRTKWVRAAGFLMSRQIFTN